MRKLLLSMLVVAGTSSAFALDMNKLMCKHMKITSATTLKQVQDNCLISDQTHYNGMYEVKFTNDDTKKTVKCDFATDHPTARVNGCR